MVCGRNCHAIVMTSEIIAMEQQKFTQECIRDQLSSVFIPAIIRALLIPELNL